MSQKHHQSNSPGYLTRRRGLILSLVSAFVFTDLAATPSCKQTNQVPEAGRKTIVAEKDNYCDAESCPGQVLFKLNKCPANLDLKRVGEQFTAFAKNSTGVISPITIDSVTNDCIFVADAPNLKVKDLMQIFQVIFTNQVQNKMMLNQDDSNDIVLQDFEPNFKMHIDVESGNEGERFQETGTYWWFSSAEPGTDAVTAWEKFGDGSGDEVVGVLDTGIARDNQNLSGNIWKASKAFNVTLGRHTIHCEKDAIGFDAVNSNSGTVCLPDDDNGHGTHVAGIISSSGTPRVGVNKQAKLFSLKIADANGGTCVSNVLKAIDFAIQVQRIFGIKLRVLNNSYYVVLSCPEFLTMLNDHILAANEHNMLFVASAGETDSHYPEQGNNDDYSHYPSSFTNLPNVISVTAISQESTLSEAHHEIANYGKTSVSLGAPGSSILSTYLPVYSTYSTKTGTSMAAPFVSGAAALLLSVPGCSTLSPSAVREKILGGTVRTDALVDKTATNGRLNIFNAIRQCARQRVVRKGKSN